MTRQHSPLPYELPQPHASTSKQPAAPASPRSIFQPVDQNRPPKRSHTESSPQKESKGPKRARAPTPIAALPSEQSQDRGPSTALFLPEEEGDEEGVLFSEEQAEDDAEDRETLIPETTEPLGVGQAEADRDPEEDVDGLGGPMEPLGAGQGDRDQPVDVPEEAEDSEDEDGSVDEDDEDDEDGQDDQEDFDAMEVNRADRVGNVAAATIPNVAPAAVGAASTVAQTSLLRYPVGYKVPRDRRSMIHSSTLGYDTRMAASTQGPDASYHSGDSDDYDMPQRPILERTLIKKDLRQLTKEFTQLGWDRAYHPIDRLGEGTFSSVYLAVDMEYSLTDNRYWAEGLFNDVIGRPLHLGEGARVALKKVLATSSPERIQNELMILEYLRGSEFVTQLIGAFRDTTSGGTMIVLPYFDGDDFRFFYKHMDVEHIRSYMFTLIFGLYEIHRRGIIHRDIKPANFLYNYEKQTGMICDFGLAERYVVPKNVKCQHTAATLENLHGVKQHTNETRTVEQAHYDANKRRSAGEGKVGFLKDDKRSAIRTNRSGTRGFRAPEVLLKCPDQTVAIDVWSAGVILLGILTQKFPTFNSSDDTEALMELASLFGRQPMERCALLHNRTFISNVPAIDGPRSSLKNVILQLNPDLYTPPMPDATPEQAQTHIEDIDKVISLCVDMLTLDATKRPTARKLLKHKFFQTDKIRDMWASRPQHYEDVHGELRIIHPTMGKCGQLHSVGDTGLHEALEPDGESYFMGFGEGYPLIPGQLCPLHEHLQQRMGKNVLAHCLAAGAQEGPAPPASGSMTQQLTTQEIGDMYLPEGWA